MNYHQAIKCRICSGKDFELVLDLGMQPPANSFTKRDDLKSNEDRFPLRLFLCKNCFLLQLLDIVDKEYLYKKYVYLSSANKPMIKHFFNYAEEVWEEFLKNKKDPFVVEIGSNDGTLLKEFKKFGASVLGVEPATNIAEIAITAGVNTKNEFFNLNLANVLSKNRKADIIIGNNVVGHIDNLLDLFQGVNSLLTDDGIFIFEVPHAINLLRQLEFDTIYHEHLSYFSVIPIIELVKQCSLEIINVKKQSVHGGTIRVYVGKSNMHEINDNVKKIITEEQKYGINKIETYIEFSNNVCNLKEDIVTSLRQLKEKNMKIFGYGASAKGNVLLNFCNIDATILDFIIDTTPLKHGLFTPGTHIPILSSNKIKQLGNDYVAFLLAWNYKSEILEKEEEFRRNGGKFLVPIPEPQLL